MSLHFTVLTKKKLPLTQQAPDGERSTLYRRLPCGRPARGPGSGIEVDGKHNGQHEESSQSRIHYYSSSYVVLLGVCGFGTPSVNGHER